MSPILDFIGDVGIFLFDLPFYIYVFTKAILTSLFGWILPARKVPLDGKTILVTGAAAGLGKSIVLNIARKFKVTLILWDINETELSKTAAEIQELGSVVCYYVVVLSRQHEIISTAEKVRKEVGPVDVLYNNVGFAHYNTFLESDPVMEDKVIKINLMSHMWTTREFLPDMIKAGKGHIISTCSQAIFVCANFHK